MIFLGVEIPSWELVKFVILDLIDTASGIGIKRSLVQFCHLKVYNFTPHAYW